MNRPVALFALTAGMIASIASAAIITQTKSIDPAQSDVVANLSFTRFNPALGTLTGVTITASAHVGPTTAVMTWNGPGLSPAVTFGFLAEYAAEITQGAVSIVNKTASTPYFTSPLSKGLKPGESHIYINSMDRLSANETVHPVDFTPYTGTGSVDFNVKLTVPRVGVSVPENYSFTVATRYDANVTVEYTYTAIPGPGAAGLLGVAGLMASRRRRSAPV